VSASARYTVSALVNYAIVGSGIVAGLSALGLRWSQLQWLVAALGVGIGFGLQEIIANFISGLIILFERPIRVGDFVSTGYWFTTLVRWCNRADLRTSDRYWTSITLGGISCQRDHGSRIDSISLEVSVGPWVFPCC
jgi:small-conductance mechanosensitive channel